MIIAPLGIAAALGQVQSFAQNILSSDAASTAKSFDQVMKNACYDKAKKLLGSQVTVQSDNGLPVTGTVENVEMTDNSIFLQVDGHKYHLAKLQDVLGKQNKGVTV